MEAQKPIMKFLGFILLAGCAAQPDNNQFFSTAEKPLVFDPVYQQDLINLDDLDLPMPIDKENEIDEQVLEPVDKKEQVNLNPVLEEEPITQSPAEKNLIPVEVKPVPKEVKPTSPVATDKTEVPAPIPAPKVTPRPVVKPPVVQTPAPEINQDPRTSRAGIGSVYYLPVLTEKRNCADNKKVHMRDLEGKILALLCRDEIWNCAMQGSCFYNGSKGLQLFAYRDILKVKNPVTGRTVQEPRFVINNSVKKCPYGMGFKSLCLDPYRSVAADQKYHKAGDVVYLPKMVGQKLPNGETHDGYFVVRDIGERILGEGRFDFFIGFDDYRNHLFSKLNLSNPERSTFTYYRVSSKQAEEIRMARAYPLVPSSNKISTMAILDSHKKAGGSVVSQSETAMENHHAKFEIR